MKILRSEVKKALKGGMREIFDEVDNWFKSALNITDEEFDFICERATDEELEWLIGSPKGFADRRKMLQIRNKYLKLMKDGRKD